MYRSEQSIDGRTSILASNYIVWRAQENRGDGSDMPACKKVEKVPGQAAEASRGLMRTSRCSPRQRPTSSKVIPNLRAWEPA